MNKKALLGKLVILVAVIIFLIGAFIYFTGIGLNFKLFKNINVNIDYRPDEKPGNSEETIEINSSENSERIIELPEDNNSKNNETNSTINLKTEIILDNNNSYNLTNVSN